MHLFFAFSDGFLGVKTHTSKTQFFWKTHDSTESPDLIDLRWTGAEYTNYPNSTKTGAIKFPVLGNQTMQMYGKLEEFSL